MTNPKSLLFMFAFLAQFVDPAQKLAGVLSLRGVATASATVGQWLHPWPKLLTWQTRFAGSVPAVLGVRLAFAGLLGTRAPATGREP